MSRDVLRDELLGVSGVAEAEVDDADGDGPVGVRVKLTSEADPRRVGEEVQRVLATHGIRSRVGPLQIEQSEPPPPPGAPDRIVSIADFEPSGPSSVSGRRTSETGLDALIQRAGDEQAKEATGPDEPAPGAPAKVTGATLAGVSVEETQEGVVVTARAEDGRTASRRARWSDGGLNEAVIIAVAALAGDEAPPLVISVQESEFEGTPVVTVVLERADGRKVAGAAVVDAGAPFALARAAWAALAGG